MMGDKEHWLLWRDGAHEPALNMAIDELLLQKASGHDKVLLRIYGWDRKALTIGLSQLFPAELDAEYNIVRRPTGGGVVYHDVDLTYTVVIPPNHPICALDRMASYKVFHLPLLGMLEKDAIAATLQAGESSGVDRATMRCFVSPSRFDVVSPEDGSKFAGAAQRRTREGILHQGSIVLPPPKMADKENLASLLIDALADSFDVKFDIFEVPDDLLTQAEAVAERKYRTNKWNKEHTLD